MTAQHRYQRPATINENPVLAFDPEQENQVIKDIFRHRIARTLWLGIKPGHVVNQYFSDNCLALGRNLETWIAARAAFEATQGERRKPGRPRKEPKEITSRFLSNVLQPYDMIGGNEDFGERLWPYIVGEKTITHIVSLVLFWPDGAAKLCDKCGGQILSTDPTMDNMKRSAKTRKVWHAWEECFGSPFKMFVVGGGN